MPTRKKTTSPCSELIALATCQHPSHSQFHDPSNSLMNRSTSSVHAERKTHAPNRDALLSRFVRERQTPTAQCSVHPPRFATNRHVDHAAAFAAEAVTDRICIASNGKEQFPISADDDLSCCGLICGDGYEEFTPIRRGNSVKHSAGLQAILSHLCGHRAKATTARATAYIVSKKVTDIQKEIMTNGPVEVSYNHTAGALRGGHAVKMIGWGTENGTPYWICSNSWNSDWGENGLLLLLLRLSKMISTVEVLPNSHSGFFRIIRGLDECGIESGVVRRRA
ncbi:papain family cysteine protease [Ostertagia ostertagi]